jgi:hypothetical protein
MIRTDRSCREAATPAAITSAMLVCQIHGKPVLADYAFRRHEL